MGRKVKGGMFVHIKYKSNFRKINSVHYAAALVDIKFALGLYSESIQVSGEAIFAIQRLRQNKSTYTHCKDDGYSKSCLEGLGIPFLWNERMKEFMIQPTERQLELLQHDVKRWSKGNDDYIHLRLGILTKCQKEWYQTDLLSVDFMGLGKVTCPKCSEGYTTTAYQVRNKELMKEKDVGGGPVEARFGDGEVS